MKAGIVVVGSSAGGLKALEALLAGLPGDYPLPVVAVQHRSRESTDAYADVIAGLTTLPVQEVEDHVALKAPGLYLAPPDYDPGAKISGP